MMRVCYVLFGAAAVLLASGCYTNQFLGTARATGSVTLGPSDRFRVADVAVLEETGLDQTERSQLLSYMTEDPARIVGVCNRVCDGGGEGEDLSLEVVLTKYHHQSDTGRMLLYFLSLGTLPGLMTTDGEAVVRVRGPSGDLKGSYDLSFRQWCSVTCYTPFALFSTPDQDAGAQVNELTKTALFVKVSGRYGMMEQVRMALGDTVAAGLREFLKKGRADRSAGAGQDPLLLVPAMLMTTP